MSRRSNNVCRGLSFYLYFANRLILFPINNKKVRKGEASEEEQKMATQLVGTVLPLSKSIKREKARVPTEEEKKFHAFHTIRKARANKRLQGIRAKKAKEASESLDAPKKKE